MQIFTMEQYSPEWWEERNGLPTASIASKIVTPTGAKSASARAVINTLIADLMGCGDEPMEPNEWMLRGTALEPEARALYEMLTDTKVEEVGFVKNDAGTAGASPDGLIYNGDDPVMGWEVKCPKASTHIGYLIGGGLPSHYKPQVHWSMAVTGLKTWEFMSYHPEIEPLVVTVPWSDYTDKIVKAIDDFEADFAKARERFNL
jgi:hypothetical protein